MNEDLSRQPRDGDRNPVRDRIRRAVAEGRISGADGDIRLRNVDSAQSLSDLGLVVRDLDQLESVIAPATAARPTTAAEIAGASRGSRRTVVAAVVGVLLLALLGAGAAGIVAFRGGGSGSVSSSELGDPVPITSEEPIGSEVTDDPDEPSATPSAQGGPAYTLSAEGVRTFVRTYRQRFGTTRAVSATFYGDYVVVQVPVAGKQRHTGWVYRQASGFEDFGGTSANFPGSAAVDLARLDVAALFKNLSLAKRVLRVEDADQAYVNIDYRPRFDPAPNVNIYLSNEFRESGYLATRLDGRVERSYPFTAQ